MGAAYDPSILPRKLREGREFRNYSQQGMADSLGIHVTSYNKWELGKHQPNAVDVIRIANELSLRIDFFFTDIPARDADLKYPTADKDALMQLAERLETIERKITPKGEMDPVLLAVDNNPTLRRFVERLRHLDESRLQRVLDKVDGYLEGLEEGAKEGEEKRA